MDIQLELDRAIGEGPPLPEPSVRVAAGRAALRRRRRASGVTAVAVAVVLGGTAYAVSGDDGAPAKPDGKSLIATDGPAPIEGPALVDGIYEPGPGEPPVSDGELTRLLDDGRVVVLRERVEVVRLINLPSPRPEVSQVAAEVRYQGNRFFVAMQSPNGGPWVNERYEGPLTLEAWAAEQTAEWLNVAGSGKQTSEFVEVAADGSLTAVPPWTIVEQRREIRFPDNFAPPGAPTWAAHLTSGGQTVFVVVRQEGGNDPDVIPSEAKPGITTLDEFLDWARQRYVDEVGLR